MRFIHIHKNAERNQTLPHVLPPQNLSLHVGQAKGAGYIGLVSSLISGSTLQLIQQSGQSLCITRAAIEMSPERDHLSARVTIEATSSDK